MSRRKRLSAGGRGMLTAFLLGGCAGPAPAPAPSADTQAALDCPDALPARCTEPTPSYQAAVAPIVAQSCVRCHDHDQGACAHSLSGYPAVFANRAAMMDHLFNCTMPPSTEPPLGQPERALLLEWLVCGAPDN